LNGVSCQQEEHPEVSNAQPVIIALGLELEHVATQVFSHFLHPPADVAPLLLGQRPQLLSRLLADFDSVTHGLILPVGVSLDKRTNLGFAETLRKELPPASKIEVVFLSPEIWLHGGHAIRNAAQYQNARAGAHPT
jgi:hypothetical protein